MRDQEAVLTTTRLGLIVPSSNTTMETEIPAMLRARESLYPERFTFHSSRMRMQHVDPEQLRAMDAQALRCAEELSDARVDLLLYACLVAIMAQGKGYHRTSERRLAEAADTAVVTSAGALTEAVKSLGARKVSVIAPYMKPLTSLVCGYIESEGIEVHDALSLEVSDNLEVGRLDPENLVALADKVDTNDVDALVLSACVQMPSLPAVQPVQDKLGIPVVTASVATVWQALRALKLPAEVPNAGWLLTPAARKEENHHVA